MSDEDKSSKTEEPSGKKLEEAMEKGQFAKAEEIGVMFGLIAGFLAILFIAHKKASELMHFSITIFSQLGVLSITEESVSHWAQIGMGGLLMLIYPLLLLTSVAAIFAGGIQSGFRLTPKVIEFKLDKLNPTNGIKQLINKQKLVKFGVDLAKFFALISIVYLFIMEIMEDPIFYAAVPPSYVGNFMWHAALVMFARLIGAIGVIALVNFIYQKHKTHADMMMTKQEVKDEAKQQDGDPKIKSKRRQMAMQLAMQQMLDAVPMADVVVTNPTHYAVALKYERGVDAAPVVLAKGRNLYAQKIKGIARENGVPIVENKPAARMLFKIGEPGRTIPLAMYQVVAEILSYVYRKHRYYFHRLKTRRLANA